MTSLSLCLIVRDEQEMLPRFLSAVAGLADEIVAVDTGSTDDTVALLEAAGARVERRPWTGDFAAARNASLDLATGDWALVLDPDELPGDGFADALRAVLASGQHGAAAVTIRNLLPHGHHRDSVIVRAFRRDPSVRYVHRIHEDATASVLALLEREDLALGSVAPLITHLGYLRERAEDKDKKTRDRELLEQVIVEEPDDLYVRFKLLELARFWGDEPMLAASAKQTWAAVEARPALRDALREAPWGGELLALIATGRFHDLDPRLDFLMTEGARVTTSPAFLLARAELLERAGRSEEARADFQRCLELADATIQRTTTRPLLGLARLALAGGDVTNALASIEAALAHSPRDPEGLLSALALRRDDPAAFGDFAGRHLELHGPTDELARALLQVGAIGAAEEVLRARLPRDPAAGIGILVCDLLRAQSSALELELTQEQADRALRSWVTTVQGAIEPVLLERLRAVAPAVAATFPWLPDAVK